MRYYIGKLAVDRYYKLKEGLQHLLHYAKKDIKIAARSWGVSPGTVYYYIGKCYLLLNDKSNAKTYLQKAIAENPNYKEAKELMQKM
jgi:tetratricopeptide (TPR) repeat protein